MKSVLLILLSIFFLINCNSRQADNQIDNNAIVQHKDTVKKDTSLEIANRILNNPFRDINNFEIKFGDRFIDSLHSLYSSQRQTKATLTKDICIGDNCESYITIANKQENAILYLFKGDGGEYGFSNDQFYVNKDSLKYVRNFNVNVETWPTDSSQTEWKIKETVYDFHGEKPCIRTRTVFTREFVKFDFTLRKVVPESYNEINFGKVYQEKLTQLKKMLEMKDSEYRE